MNNNYTQTTGTTNTVTIGSGSSVNPYSISASTASGFVYSPFITTSSTIGGHSINFGINDFFSIKKRKGIVNFYYDFVRTKDYKKMKAIQDNSKLIKNHNLDDWFMNPYNSNPWGNATWTV